MIIALRTALVTLVLTGLAYPLAVTGLAQVMFPGRANGSLITDDKGREVGSELIGQAFTGAGYLHGRPSSGGYDAAASGGTNLGTTSQKLRDGARELATAYRAQHGVTGELPVDAVTRSASGLDPHISPANAALQAARIAAARGVAVERVQAVIAARTEDRELGFLGEPRVNVLVVNLALDRQFGRPARLSATMPR